MRRFRGAHASRGRGADVRLAAVLAVVVAMVLGGCQLLRVVGHAGSTPSNVVPGLIATVELGIYSGRPDPSWSLTVEESNELGRLLGSLPSTIGEPPDGGLGYHGFVLRGPGVGHPSRTLVAYRGAIAEPGSRPRRYLVDVGRSVERYLLDGGRDHLTPDEVAAVEADLATAAAR